MCMRSRYSVSNSLHPYGCQVPLSMGFSRQEYWSGLPCSPPGDLPDSGTQPRLRDSGSLMSPALTDGFFTPSATSAEKAMAPHSSTLAWKIPWMEELGGPHSMGSRLSMHTRTCTNIEAICTNMRWMDICLPYLKGLLFQR